MIQKKLFLEIRAYALKPGDDREAILKTNPLLGPTSPEIGYEEYIRSNDWSKKKKFAIQLADYKCLECGKRGYLEVHHPNYECLYKERNDDVEVLCRQCHIEADQLRIKKNAFDNAYCNYMERKYGENWLDYNNRESRQYFRYLFENGLHHQQRW